MLKWGDLLSPGVGDCNEPWSYTALQPEWHSKTLSQTNKTCILIWRHLRIALFPPELSCLPKTRSSPKNSIVITSSCHKSLPWEFCKQWRLSLVAGENLAPHLNIVTNYPISSCSPKGLFVCPTHYLFSCRSPLFFSSFPSDTHAQIQTAPLGHIFLWILLHMWIKPVISLVDVFFVSLIYQTAITEPKRV